MTKHMQTAGVAGLFIYARDEMSGEELAALHLDDRYYVRDTKGFMYVIAQRRLEPNEPLTTELSMRKLVEDKRDIHGPLVSRRRVDLSAHSMVALADRDGRVIITPNEDGTETWEPDEEWQQDIRSRDFTDDEGAFITDWINEHRGELILSELYDMVRPLGIERDAKQKTIALGDAQADSGKRLSADEVLEAVWLDDGWITTIEEIVTVAEDRGHDVSEGAIGKALQRGPYEHVSEARRGQSATWKRTALGDA